MPSNLGITFVGKGESEQTTNQWLNLEQVKIPEIFNAASLSDLAQMYSRVISGLSARTYKPMQCPVRIEGENVIVPVDFNVFPSSMDLQYSLKPGFGELSVPRAVDEDREFDVIVPMSTQVNLPFLAGNVHTYWQTPCYNRFGERISQPGRTAEGSQITLEHECFGVLRVICRPIGHQYTCEMTFAKGNYSITGVKNGIVATWMDENNQQQNETLQLELPGCAEELLETCGDNGEDLVRSVVDIEHNDPNIMTLVYSTCTGKPIGVYYE